MGNSISTSTPFSSGSPSRLPGQTLSQRASSGEGNLAEYITKGFTVVNADEYNDKTNPDGYFNMAVAENKLTFHRLNEKLTSIHTENDLPAHVSQYDNGLGTMEFRTALSKFLAEYVFHAKNPVNSDHIVVSNGLSGMIDAVTHCLCDEGEGVLTPTPMYAGFVVDSCARAKATIVEVPTTSKTNFILSVDDLEKAYQKAINEGITPRLVLLASPNNPTAVMYSKQLLKDIFEWTLSKPGMHVISDEIYALSAHGASEEHSFISGYEVAEENEWLGSDSRIHIMHGFSKDFGLSGFRVGTMYTSNTDLIGALGKISYFFAASFYVQHLLARVLNDEEFLSSFLKYSVSLLEDNHREVEKRLKKIGIPYIPAQAGFFVWINLGGYLVEDSLEGERKMWVKLLDEGKLNMTPGVACRCVEHGWFRLCFVNYDRAGIAVALDRLEALLG